MSRLKRLFFQKVPQCFKGIVANLVPFCHSCVLISFEFTTTTFQLNINVIAMRGKLTQASGDESARLRVGSGPT